MLTQVKAIIGVFSRRRENTFSAYYEIIQKNHFHTPRVKIESGDASNIADLHIMFTIKQGKSWQFTHWGQQEKFEPTAAILSAGET